MPSPPRRVTGPEKYLRQDADSAISLGEETLDLKFKDQLLEQCWKVEELRLNIMLGSRTMLFVTAGVSVMQTATNIRRLHSSWFFNDPKNFVCMGAEYVFLLSNTALLIVCLYRPRAILYYPLLLGWSIYILVMGFPPWSTSCTDLFQIYLDHKDKFKYRMAANALDCTLQGHTLTQICMAWVLLTPRIFPSMKLMNFNWFWIFFMYLGTSLWYREHYNEKFFKVSDIGMIVGLLSLTNLLATGRKFYMSKSQRSKWIANAHQREASEKMFRILEYMVPVHVIVPMLKNPGAPIADQVSRVSILFIMIVNFDQFTSSLSAEELLAFLNRYFTLFDSVCAVHEVTKIETVHEEYVCAVGVTPDDVEIDETRGHGDILGRLVTVASEILKLQSVEDGVQFKMGINTGPIVAGVIGQKLPRFRLFGDTINTAARMMQKGIDGQLQFGEETKRELPEWVPIKLRGEIEMKGKGQVTAYLYDREAAETTRAPVRKRRRSEHRVSFELGGEEVPGLQIPREPISMLVLNASPTASVCNAAEEVEGEQEASEEEAPEQKGRERGTRKTLLPGRPWRSTTESSSRTESRKTLLPSGLLRSTTATQESSPRLQDGSETASARTTLATPRMTTRRRLSSRTSSRPTYASSSRPTYASSSSLGRNTEFTEAPVNPFFEEALMELQRAGEEEGTESFWRCSCGLKKENFSPAMEAGWLKWFHESTIMKKLDHRMDKQERYFAWLTTLELVWMVSTGTAFQDHATYPARLRLPIFLFCRVTSFAILLLWRLLVTFRGNGWIRARPSSVQFCLCISGLCIAALLFISYDSLSSIADVIPIRWPEGEEPFTLDEMRTLFEGHYNRGGMVFSLVVVPMYFMTQTMHPLRFWPTMSFVVLAAFLVFADVLIPSFRWNWKFSPNARCTFIFISCANLFQALSAEQDSRARYKCKVGLEEATERTEKILNTLMPPMVVEEIRDLPSSAGLPATKYSCATVAQSDLVGFTKLASTRTPEEVVEFISELFGYFDELTDEHGVYKVETVGDAYIAGQAGVPLTLRNCPTDVLLFGIGMVEKTGEWARNRGLSVKCRVGVHTAECIGGIIGTEMQRYHLFGELMTAVEVLESTAPEGKVQVSPACKEAAEFSMRNQGLPSNYIGFVERTGKHLTTSKGEVHEFDEVGGRTWVIANHLRIIGGLS